MKLLAGSDLSPEKYFEANPYPLPKARASSFDLTIGYVFDDQGKQVDEEFLLKPGCMVQVVSAEVFRLPMNVTGHVTYKTDMTRKGIWALTVGIVDPGWRCPIATTLLNFSKVDYLLQPGQAFLRVSLFEHKLTSRSLGAGDAEHKAYLAGVKSLATQFPKTFLDMETIAEKAGEGVLDKIRSHGLAWVGVIAGIFAIASLVSGALQFGTKYIPVPSAEMSAAAARLDAIDAKLKVLERRSQKNSSN